MVTSHVTPDQEFRHGSPDNQLVSSVQSAPANVVKISSNAANSGADASPLALLASSNTPMMPSSTAWPDNLRETPEFTHQWPPGSIFRPPSTHRTVGRAETCSTRDMIPRSLQIGVKTRAVAGETRGRNCGVGGWEKRNRHPNTASQLRAGSVLTTGRPANVSTKRQGAIFPPQRTCVMAVC